MASLAALHLAISPRPNGREGAPIVEAATWS